MKKSILHICIFIVLTGLASCNKQESRQFTLLDASQTGIDFNNKIQENDSVNVFGFMNIYTGAGVAVGDVNNDGLVDVYFSGNMVSGRLYLNKGDMQFGEVTREAGLMDNKWGTGAVMVDINQDGFLDIYVCVSGGGDVKNRANMLYINNGPSEGSGQITFTEKAAEYGLADTRQSMHAAFFDYDKDNDLDMYLLVNPAAYEYQVNTSLPRKLNGESISNDRLYENNGNGTFTDVSMEAGILVEGYGLGVGISDINDDNWPDIYVSNDFIGNDIMYINQKDGTFKDEISKHINHTSYAGMGNDIADIDNNGKPDIMVLDMRPEDNERQKLIISSTGYDRFQLMLEAGYDPQYSRNTLQLNQGEGKFSEIGNLAGVSSTDWSWSALLADYDNDGYKDMYITNGFLRDLGNLDYIHYQGIYDNPLGEREVKIQQKLESITHLPPAKLVNYAYKNEGGITFKKVSENWGIVDASCSNGAAYADLDNDGDLDLLVNNVNQKAFVYQNNAKKNHFLKIKLKGKPGNHNGIGTKIELSSRNNTQHYQHYLSRGYESSVEPTAHFGLGKDSIIERIKIQWPDDSIQILNNVRANQTIMVSQKDAGIIISPVEKMKSKEVLFSDVTDSLGISFKHQEDDMVDFKLQPILPHMHSRNGPGISVSDINNDGLDDFFVGGATQQSGQIYTQEANGNFTVKELGFDLEKEDMGSLFFDADNDGDQDLYVVSGGVLIAPDTSVYQDRLYMNDGKGNFTQPKIMLLPSISGSLVTASDFDKDGDLDLFVGGRISPGKYPLPVQSFLLENRTVKGEEPIFVHVGNRIDGWDNLTMVTAANWTDYDNDGWLDLIVVGEFMPITLFHNDNGTLKHVQNPKGLEHTEGWWNSISGGDFDNDGDIDYILGNLGLNTKFKATADEPLCIYASDYDKDGRIDPVMCYYIEGKNYLAHSRDEIISQINAMRSRFKTYESYAKTPFKESFLPEEIEQAYIVKSHLFKSSYMENLGDGSFKLKGLPLEVQLAPIEGILVEDFNEDGNLDIALTGNSYGTEVATGRYDALLGSILMGNGDGTFNNLSLEESGFLNNFDGSGLAKLKNDSGRTLIISANNNGPLKTFALNNYSRTVRLGDDVIYVDILYENGEKRKQEFSRGTGYLSQSSRRLTITNNIKEIQAINYKGDKKIIYSK
ncbi:VCBS repeat-containing protein [Maribacter aestuarii]|uniref:VCBS repeat-containing protein n=1 Tax=Maribacter aestuarii TaxID=1130723 RepID=UPI00248C79B5|nr:VCBS repeat-containing protein [Maribacter aestuarii]